MKPKASWAYYPPVCRNEPLLRANAASLDVQPRLQLCRSLFPWHLHVNLLFCCKCFRAKCVWEVTVQARVKPLKHVSRPSLLQHGDGGLLSAYWLCCLCRDLPGPRWNQQRTEALRDAGGRRCCCCLLCRLICPVDVLINVLTRDG